MNNKNKRKEQDKKKLAIAGFEIADSTAEDPNEFYVTNFKGPSDSLYEGGKWKLHIVLPENYPFKSPSIGFVNKIYHPNVDEKSGTICLDVINQTWSPFFELKNIFEEFLPQLLHYPNASDPLNTEAADMLLHNKKEYEEKVKKYVRQYAFDSEYKKKEVILEHKEDNKEVKGKLLSIKSKTEEKLTDLNKTKSVNLSNKLSLDGLEIKLKIEEGNKFEEELESLFSDDNNLSSKSSSISVGEDILCYGKLHQKISKLNY